MSDLQFDRCQFANKRVRAVSAETCISFNDYNSMHLVRYKPHTKRRKPERIEWAFNDDTLRNVILTFLERRFFISRRVHPGATNQERIAAIEKAAKDGQANRLEQVNHRLDWYNGALEDGTDEKRLKELASEAQVADSRAMFDRRPVEVLTNLVWLSYRQGYDSTTVAEQLHITPWHVRIILYRLNHLAADLAAGIPYRRDGKKRRPRSWTPEELRKLWFLRANGLSWGKCARALGRGRFVRNYGYHGSNLAAIYHRYFEQELPVDVVKEPKLVRTDDLRRKWLPEKLRALWSLRAVGMSYKQCGKVFGISAMAARFAFVSHFGKP